MTKAPAFQFYASDFVDDTMEWSVYEAGIYIRLLCFQWINKSLPVEPGRLARLAGCEEKQFSEAWKTIKTKFHINGDGRIYNKRLEEIRVKQDTYREKQREAGLKGVRVRLGEPITDPTTEPCSEKAALLSSSLNKRYKHKPKD